MFGWIYAPFRGAISIGPEAFEDCYYFLMDGGVAPPK